ncbi:uncharacterized protein LOC129972155 isoform X2 [Argiope bruennichi]|uniref:uncharacterized protein LOC129972155 isoform X2 n=1 Tax=Argiope bruennichi TaxID=94029 RepID=UPI0024956EEE|nr:uncharacterized protein LOC129972155 isoform X2 [Argiope bruennichi]
MALDFSKYYNAHSILQKKLLFQESNAETSFECTLIPGSSKRYENPEFIESCPAVLEPSKDKFRSEEEITRNLLEIFSAPPNPPPAFLPALIGSSSIRSFDLGNVQLSNEEQPRATTCCSAVINYYRKSAIAFRNSSEEIFSFRKALCNKADPRSFLHLSNFALLASSFCNSHGNKIFSTLFFLFSRAHLNHRSSWRNARRCMDIHQYLSSFWKALYGSAKILGQNVVWTASNSVVNRDVALLQYFAELRPIGQEVLQQDIHGLHFLQVHCDCWIFGSCIHNLYS